MGLGVRVEPGAGVRAQCGAQGSVWVRNTQRGLPGWRRTLSPRTAGAHAAHVTLWRAGSSAIFPRAAPRAPGKAIKQKLTLKWPFLRLYPQT